MTITISAIFLVALFCSLFTGARILNGVAMTHSGRSTDGMLSLPGMCFFTSVVWALFYYATHCQS